MYLFGELADRRVADDIVKTLGRKGIQVNIKLSEERGLYQLYVENENDVPTAFDLYRVKLGLPPVMDVPEEVKAMRSLPMGKVTLFIIGISVALFLGFIGGKGKGAYGPFMMGLPQIIEGQLWRLITPIFLHFSFLHIIFNMLWTKELGSMVEYVFGPGFLIGFVLIVGVLSNLGQLLISGPNFGGMSGVVYGLLGLLWIYKTLVSDFRFGLPKGDISMMIIWFFICLFGLIPQVANMAHGIGLALGMLIGIVMALPRRNEARFWSRALTSLAGSLAVIFITIAVETSHFFK